ncbi:DUF4136 domain-containing protein [Robertkochia flava]|uniref:DUF4136 domain-containing protein n=1 Tax=Robertkochia flava TaxID=3447986 RepID=UPI001CCE3A72|nr:DUF4136 domain-containing protein [Robertkochia marina]
MKRKMNFIVLVLLCLGIISCQRDDVTYVDELDVVYTNYSEQIEFSGLQTYSIPDKVIEIKDEDFDEPGQDPEFIDDVYASVILGKIRENMDAYGWTETSKDNNPDVVVLVSVMTTTNLFYYYDWGYWNWWGYPGYGPGWGWWYPGYYPPLISGYRSGSVLIQMTYPDGIGANETIPVIWTAVINGLLEGSTNSINTRLQNTIDQSFIQSSYLRKP